MNNQHTAIQIERFLRSLMETAEREAFLQQIETDPALARQVRIHKVEIAVMEEFAREGWIGLGWQIGRDSMHFQPTR